MEKYVDDIAARRMRKVRPAYRKIARVIDSCRTIEHLASACRMVFNFHVRFPYAERFTVNLHKRLCDHRHGEQVMQMIQDGRI